MSKYSVKNFTRIAFEKLRGDTSTLDGIEQWLKAWFCLTYNTTENDDRLLDMTVEELLILHQLHRVKNNPTEVEVELNGKTSEDDDFEQWLKEEMGETYLTNEEMVEGMKQEEEEYQEKMQKLKKDLPSKISTDFTQFNKEN